MVVEEDPLAVIDRKGFALSQCNLWVEHGFNLAHVLLWLKVRSMSRWDLAPEDWEGSSPQDEKNWKPRMTQKQYEIGAFPG